MVRIIIVILICFITLSACDNYTSGPRFEGDVYAVSALLMAGKPINSEHPVYLTRSADVSEFNPMNLFVSEADVRITELESGQSWTLSPIADMQEMTLKWIDPQEHIIQAEYSYKIEIEVPGYEPLISAQTTVPPLANLNPDYYQHNVEGEGYSLDPQCIGTVPYTVSDVRYPVAMNTFDMDSPCYFMTEFYCLEEFSTQLEFTNPVLGAEHPTQEMETEYYSSGEGLRRIYMMGRFDPQFSELYQQNYILLKNYRQGFIFYGRYRVSAYLTDDNYYRYKYAPEGYLLGGVQNALGYFGSASGGVMYIEIARDPETI